MKSVNGTGIKRAALINDYSCLGKCSLSVAVPIVSALGVEAVALPTAVLSTHTGPDFGEYAIKDMTQEMMAFAAHWKRLGVKFDCIFTGFFSSAEQIDIAQNFIDDFADDETTVIVDPVLGDSGKIYPCFDGSYVEKMRSLIQRADVVTPNVTEASLLAGCPFDTDSNEILDKLNVPNAIITGVHHNDEIGYCARIGDSTKEIFYPYVAMELHGTGDVFSSALCGALMNYDDIEKSLEFAAQFCNECIVEAAKRQPEHWYGLPFEVVLKRRMNL